MIFRCSIIFLLIVISAVLLCYVWISHVGKRYSYQDINKLPYRQTGLLLGTNKYVAGGRINTYYRYRIAAAAKLYHAGKIDYLVVSGDNRKNNYNEPKQMRADLILAGVPAAHIQPDYAGLRTLDSILRMDKVFGHQDYVIISQAFHNQRAVFLAHAKGQSPLAFNAQSPPFKQMLKVLFRELFARVKAVLDLLLNTQAKHYGEPIIFPPEKALKENLSSE